jgi:hypothetical protein
MGKLSDSKAVSALVPGPNLTAIEEFLQNDTEQDKKVIYNYQPDILQADDVPNCDDRGTTAAAINRQYNGQRINYTCNGLMMLTSDDGCYEGDSL